MRSSRRRQNQTSFPVQSERLLSRPGLTIYRPGCAAEGKRGAEPPGATRSAIFGASMARTASTQPSPERAPWHTQPGWADQAIVNGPRKSEATDKPILLRIPCDYLDTHRILSVSAPQDDHVVNASSGTVRTTHVQSLDLIRASDSQCDGSRFRSIFSSITLVKWSAHLVQSNNSPQIHECLSN
jgi:hypothetical protein